MINVPTEDIMRYHGIATEHFIFIDGKLYQTYKIRCNSYGKHEYFYMDLLVKGQEELPDKD